MGLIANNCKTIESMLCLVLISCYKMQLNFNLYTAFTINQNYHTFTKKCFGVPMPVNTLLLTLKNIQNGQFESFAVSLLT